MVIYSTHPSCNGNLSNHYLTHLAEMVIYPTVIWLTELRWLFTKLLFDSLSWDGYLFNSPSCHGNLSNHYLTHLAEMVIYPTVIWLTELRWLFTKLLFDSLSWDGYLFNSPSCHGYLSNHYLTHLAEMVIYPTVSLPTQVRWLFILTNLDELVIYPIVSCDGYLSNCYLTHLAKKVIYPPHQAVMVI